MTGHTARRWPLAPLLAYLRLTPGGFARRYGIPPSQVYTARDHGLTEDQADAWTIAADLHPALIWGPEFYDPADVDGWETAA